MKIEVDLSSGRKIPNSPSPNKKFIELFPNKDNNTIHIFTDGPKIPNSDHSSVGFAIWSQHKDYNMSFRIPDLATIFTAECLALINSVNIINKYPDRDFIVFTNSESALKSLCNLYNSGYESPLITQLNNKLFTAKNHDKKIKLVWIPSHRGIVGNECVDVAAKTAAENGTLLNTQIPFSDLVGIHKNKCEEENENINLTLSNTEGKWYFENVYSNKKDTWFNDFTTLSRKAASSINRIRSNHTS